MKNLKKIVFLLLLSLSLFLVACSAKTYKVSFVTNCSTQMEEQSVSKASDIDFSKTLERTGYRFLGWFTDTEGKNPFDKDSFKLEADLKLYARWEILTFTVKFMNGDTVLDTQTVNYGSDATEPDRPTLEGKTFKSWDQGFTNVTSDLTIKAVFDDNKYTVTFKSDGVTVSTVEVKHGEAATAPNMEDKTGFAFDGWDNEFNNVTSDLTVNAKWVAKTFSIKYFDGTTELTLSPNTYTAGENVGLPSNDVTGFVFLGWFTDATFNDFALTEVDENMTGDLVLYALNVKVDYNGGAQSWVNGSFDSTNTVSKGIDAISNLPEEFEKDFFEYLSNNNLLAAEDVDTNLQATTWEKFSGLNPLHNSDPQRIWNDTSTNVSSGKPGYVGLYLYKEATLDEDGNLVDINEGFLGTEPYKTKYMNLSKHLCLLFKAKYGGNMSEASNDHRSLIGFIIDGFFYGTQSANKEDAFKALRSVIPTTTTYYTISGTTVTAHTNKYEITTEELEVGAMFAIPSLDGKTFKGWYTDSACTTLLTRENLQQKMTIYAGWK